MTNTYDDLMRLMPIPSPPVDAGNPDRWPFVEKMVGLELPADYKWFINLYGTGIVGYFVRILNPFSKDHYMNFTIFLDHFVSLITTDYEAMFPYPLYPKPNGLLPFGNTINGDTLFWKTIGPSNEWTIFLADVSVNYFEEFNGSFTEFLKSLLEDKVHGEVCDSSLIDFQKPFEPISNI